MSAAQAQELLLETIRYTREQAADGVQLFGVGELGMANTTPAAAIVSVLTGEAPESVWALARICRNRSLGIKRRWCVAPLRLTSLMQTMGWMCWRKSVVLTCWG
jgi:hypothetical protein